MNEMQQPCFKLWFDWFSKECIQIITTVVRIYNKDLKFHHQQYLCNYIYVSGNFHVFHFFICGSSIPIMKYLRDRILNIESNSNILTKTVNSDCYVMIYLVIFFSLNDIMSHHNLEVTSILIFLIGRYTYIYISLLFSVKLYITTILSSTCSQLYSLSFEIILCMRCSIEYFSIVLVPSIIFERHYATSI